MNATDDAWLDVATCSDLIARRLVTVSELVRLMLDRIEKLNPKVNAYVTVMADAALRRASILDAELTRGEVRGPLHGVVIGVKDIINVAGAPTTGGSRNLSGYIPSKDAECVTRLQAAGAIILGKLHTHELAAGATSENELYGRAGNPWNPSCVPGGSSGGSAVAVAAGLAHGAVGTDTGGSVRLPAAFCGVVGLKGTFGRVSRRGVLTRSWTMDHIGALGRRVRDVSLMFQAMAGYDQTDDYSSRRSMPNSIDLEHNVSGLRAGIVVGEHFESKLDPEVGTAFERAVATLEALGVATKRVEFPLAGAAQAAGTIITVAEFGSALDELTRESLGGFGADIRAQLQMAEFISARQYLRAMRIRPLVQRELRNLLRDVDVLLTPTVPITAPPSVGKTPPETLTLFAHNTRPFSLVGLPAISVPAGFSSSGMPIGLQVIGRPFDESTTLRIAQAYETATPWHLMRSPVSKDGDASRPQPTEWR